MLASYFEPTQIYGTKTLIDAFVDIKWLYSFYLLTTKPK